MEISMRKVEILLGDNETVGTFRVPAEISMEEVKSKQNKAGFAERYRIATRPMVRTRIQ